MTVVCAANADSHLSSDPRVQRARQLYHGGNFGGALSILRPLAGAHPDQTDVLFLTGISAIGAGKKTTNAKTKNKLFAEAVAAFRRILNDRPELTRVRLELARAFFLKGDDALSQEQFERVLAGDIPQAMAQNIRRFLSAIRARRKWRARFDFAIAPDSNLNASDDTDTVIINGLPFRLNDDPSRESGAGFVFSAGGDYYFPLSQQWRLLAGGDISRTEYRASRFDSSNAALFFGPEWRPSPVAEVALLLDWRRFFDGNNRYHRDEPSVRLRAGWRPGRKWSLNAGIHWRDLRYRLPSGNEGVVTGYSLGARYLFSPTIAGDISAGHSRAKAKSVASRYRSVSLGGGLTFALPKGWTLGGSYRRQWTRPEGQRFLVIGGGKRKAKTQIAQISVLHRAFALFGFTPRLALIREKTKTNYQIGNHSRTQANLKFLRQF